MLKSPQSNEIPLDLRTININEEKEALEGYVTDPSRYQDGAGLKISADGFVLIPQPLDTDNDPLNWSPRRKWLIITIIAYIAALADYTGGTAIITVIPQSIEWHLTQAAVQRAVVGNIFAIGACGLFVVALAGFFGRLPVTFFFQSVMVGTCVWSAASTSFDSYLAARIINGFFCSVGQGGALMWVKDLFFFHEHPRVINYIEFSIILSPYVGPLVTSFIVSGTTWRWAFWVCTILACISWFLVFFLDETYFDRTSPVVPRGSYISRLMGVQQAKSWRQRSLLQAFGRPLIAITKIPVLTILVYYFLNFAWVIGVNTTVAIWLTNLYDFSPRDLGFFYFFGVVGVLLGWLAGHFLHDAVGRFYVRRHGGRLDPEARLIITYPATLILCLSLITLGFSLQHQWHYVVIAVFAGIQCFGVMIVTTAINAYLLDCYPEGSGEVSAWTTASRSWGGFMATYIQIEWVTQSGPAKVLGIQATITFASLFLIVFLQLYGKRMRQWQGLRTKRGLAYILVYEPGSLEYGYGSGELAVGNVRLRVHMARSFSFGFGGDDIEQEVNEEGIAAEHAQIPEQHDPVSQPQLHAMKDLMQSVAGYWNILALAYLDEAFLEESPSMAQSMPYHYVSKVLSDTSYSRSLSSVTTQTSEGRTISIPRRELFDIRAQLMAEDSSSGREPIAGLSDDDIKPYVYEGGFKTWECSVDLANYLAEMLAAEEEKMLTSGLDIIELGAGSALPSLLLFDHIISRHNEGSQGTPPINLTLCDYNLSVLKLATIPNLILTWCARQCFSPLALDGDLEITSDLCDRFLLDLESRNIRITCISGAWSPRFLDLVPKPPSGSAYHVRTMVLASETIYSLATLSSFVGTLLSVLQTSIAGGTSAVGLVAAKKVYFGVGGGVDEFIRVLAENGGKANVVWESKRPGVGRVILEVKNR